jgi:hypothetical protein
VQCGRNRLGHALNAVRENWFQCRVGHTALRALLNHPRTRLRVPVRPTISLPIAVVQD